MKYYIEIENYREYYKPLKNHHFKDQYIEKWILLLLKSPETNNKENLP